MGRVIVAAMTFLISSTILFAEEMTPLQLLEKYKANHEILRSCIIQSEELTEARDSDDGDKSTWTRNMEEFRTDGKRVDSTSKRWFDLSGPDDQSAPQKPIIKTVIWDGVSWFEYIPHLKWALVSKKEQHKNEYVSFAYSGSSLNGFFWGDGRPVEDILAQSSKIDLRSQKEKVNGVDCYIIDATATSGKYSLWIDPRHGYNIAKAKVYKSGDDILYGKPMSQYKIPKGALITGKLPGKIKDFAFSMDKVEFQKVGEGWVPAKAEYQFTETYVDGRVITEKKKHNRVKIDPSPDFEAIKAFVPNIPDGTNIAMEGDDEIGYRWLQGKPVPNIKKSKPKPETDTCF